MVARWGDRRAKRLGIRTALPVRADQTGLMLAQSIQQDLAPLGIQVTKEAGRKFIEAGEEAAIAIVPQIRERVLNTADAAEGIKSFVERRAANFRGC